MALARGVTALHDEREQLEIIEGWYRRELAKPYDRPTFRYQPVILGPTWATEKRRGAEYWVLPQRTLGWTALSWCGRWLQLQRDVPWRFTLEQARFMLHWYSLESDGTWTYRDGVLQRLKGWGKDPLGAALAMFELVGPCRLYDLEGDTPVGTDNPDAWVQTAAVSLEQTKNTMRLLPGMVTAEARTQFGVQLGKEQVYALGSTRFLQAVTSSPATLEGARGSFILCNESHHWNSSNSGHDMIDVIERNATKSAGGAARILKITNAFEPGEDSVAERDRDAYEEGQRPGAGGSVGLLYDSLEASEDAPLSAELAPEVVSTIRGDSTWLHIPSIVKSILDTRNPPSRSRRFWYNQVVAAEDAWMIATIWDDCADEKKLVGPDDEIVVFFDGSKSDDTTALVGCRVSDGHIFRIGSWSKPAGEAGKAWIVPREQVDKAVASMFESYRIIAFFADPSDTRDDEGERFWEPLIDTWHRRYARQLQIWSLRSGEKTHSIAWDMRSPERTAIFTDAAQRFITEAQDRTLTHDGDRSLRAHVLNARRRPNKYGISLGKEHRESRRKVDLAVAAVGARMLRRLVLNKEPTTKKRSGRIW
jgi:hypothetical protein